MFRTFRAICKYISSTSEFTWWRMPSFLQKTPSKVGLWDTLNTLYNKERFKEAFRVSRNTFHYILQKAGPAILKKDTVVGLISPDKRLAITLYKLGRGDYNYTIDEMTGYAESTVSCLIKDVCQAIVEILWEESVTKKVLQTWRGLSSSSYRYGIREAIQVCFCCNWRFTLTTKMPTRVTRSNGTVS